MENITKILNDLSKNDPEWLKKFRLQSLENYEKFPVETSELFKYQTKFKDFVLTNLNSENLENKKIPFNLPNSENIIVQTSEGVEIKLSDKKDIVIQEIRNAIDEKEDFFKDILLNSVVNDKFEFLNNALFNSGIFIYIPPNVDLDSPIRIINFVDSTSFFIKNFIIVDANSRIRVIQEDYSFDYHDSNGLSNIYSNSLEVFLKENSQLDFFNIQNLNQNTIHFTNKTVQCAKDSRIFWNIGHLGGKKVRSRINNLMNGDGSVAEDLEIVFVNKKQQFDAYSSLVHVGKFTTGKVLLKGIMKNESESIFKGMVRIEEKAKNANSFLSEHGMLLSKDAKTSVIPGLEIETNDVKATHAASASQIEEDKIFYLMSRGMSREEAVKMISMGFFEPLLRRITFDEIRSKIGFLFELKWNGEESKFIEFYDKLKFEEIGIEKETKIEKDIFERHYKYR